MPVPLRAAGLGHEAVDHAVEHDAVVEAFARQLLDALDVLGREVGAQRDDDAAFGGLHDEGVLGVGGGHVSMLLSSGVGVMGE